MRLNRRHGIAWLVITFGIVLFWCARPLLDPTVFVYGSIVVLLGSWKVAAFLCLSPEQWERFTALRLVAFLIWPGMRADSFLVGYQSRYDEPRPTVYSFLFNLLAALAILWGLPWLLPESTPRGFRLSVAMLGLCFLTFARFDLAGLLFRALGFPVEKLWVSPFTATTLGDFWGQRWNRVVSGFLRGVVFVPLSRLVGVRMAIFLAFVYSGLYHEFVSFIADAGYGRPFLYFLLQFLGVAVENARPVRRWLRAWPLAGWLWTMMVVVGPLVVLVHPEVIDRIFIPQLQRVRGWPENE